MGYPIVIDHYDEDPDYETLRSLITESVDPIRKAFGDVVTTLRVQEDDGGQIIKVTIRLSRDFQNPEQALQNFDNDWWLKNCHRSNGNLVFDYEIEEE